MLIPWDEIKARYNEYADLLIDQINATNIIINYRIIGNLSDMSGDLNQNPGIIDEYGGRVPIQSLTDRINQTGVNYNFVPNTESLLVRAYWETNLSNKFEFSKFNFTANTKLLKINSYTSDNDKLNNAIFIEVSGIKLTNVQPPKPYGFDKRYSISYWVAGHAE